MSSRLYSSLLLCVILTLTRAVKVHEHTQNENVALHRITRNVIIDYLTSRWQQNNESSIESGDVSQARKATSDPVTSYYDFIINEGSYKFWSWFQVATAALLIYSAFAAVYYAKYTFATTDYSDYEDDFFFKRSGSAYLPEPKPQQSSFLGLSPSTYQRIMDALSSKKYS